jgi:hypothetical protein
VEGTIDCRFGRKVVPVKVQAEGSKLRLTFPFSRPMIDEVKAMEGARWSPEGKLWTVAHCDRNLLQLFILAGKPPAYYSRYLEPPPPPSTGTWLIDNLPQPRPLKAHQAKQLAWIQHVRRGILVAHMGTGKTLTAVELMEHALRLWPGAELLYVAPPKPLVATQLELRKWRTSVRPTFCTFDGLKALLEAWPAGKKAPRLVIFDESSKLKNASTKRYEHAEHLVTAMRADWKDDCFILLMTGTPSPKDPCDWHPQAELACPGFLREANVHKLRRRLAVMEQVAGPYGNFPKLVAWRSEEVELLGRRLEGLVHVTTWEEARLNLPPPVYEQVLLQPPADLLRAARLLAMTSTSAIELLNQLRQLSDGFQYASDGTASQAASPKDQALMDLLERHEASGRFITYAAYTASVDKCVQLGLNAGWQVLRCDGRGFCLSPKGAYSTTEEALLALQRPGTEDDRLCFVGQPGAGGMGLNMQGVSALCFYSNDFNAESRWQAEARPQRPGNAGLTIYDLINLPTDLYVTSNLQAKKSLQTTTIDEIRKALA